MSGARALNDSTSDDAGIHLSNMDLEAAPQVMARIRDANMRIVFVNTRAQAEWMFQALWKLNERMVPIGFCPGTAAHHHEHPTDAIPLGCTIISMTYSPTPRINREPVRGVIRG
jgi:hypothetical protein